MEVNEIHSILQDSFSEFKDMDPPPSALRITPEQIEQNRVNWFLYVKYGKPVACVNWSVQSQYLTFSYLGVLPEFRRQGLGREVVHSIEKMARDKHARRACVYIRRSITANIQFIESLGYSFYRPVDTSFQYLIYGKSLEEPK